MPAIQHLLQRLGFVKLDRFGLELTAEGRILSKRPTVLDDGGGTPVVGWQDGDFAVSELRTWQPIVPHSHSGVLPRPAQPGSSIVPHSHSGVLPRPAQPGSSIVKSSTLPAAPRTRPEMVPPVISGASRAPAVSAGVMPAGVAGEPVVDEDDWEWTIALARARASGDATQPVPRTRAATSRTQPIAIVATKDPASSAEWPKTAPIGAIDYDSRQVVAIPPARSRPATSPLAPVATRPPPTPTTRPPSAPIALTQRVSRPAEPRPATPSSPPARSQAIRQGSAPSTIIPVPSLPTLQGTALASPLEPVVRSADAAGPRRFAKGTASVGPSTSLGMIAVTEAMTEDTIPNLSIGDRTRPGIVMPAAARAVELPSAKRRALRR